MFGRESESYQRMQCDTVRKHTVTDSFRHILCVFGGLKLYTTSIKDFV